MSSPSSSATALGSRTANSEALHQCRSRRAAHRRSRELCRTWPVQREVRVRGIHYVQEDAPHEIGAALRTFLQELRGG
jgi:hypothetical protein